jgi:dolichyl-phosphate beta-glucosyltransferase
VLGLLYGPLLKLGFPQMNPEISLVIPAWNEARRLPESLRRISEFCGQSAHCIEVLVVVEPCSDDTLQIASEFARQNPRFRVIAGKRHLGKGSAVRTGVLEAAGRFIFYMDADLSVPLGEVDAFWECFRMHPSAAVLLGNRAHAQSRITRRQSFLRRNMGRIFNAVLKALSVASLHDTQCGFKAFRSQAAREIFRRQQLNGFAFDVEVLLLAEALGYGIRDLPVEWVNSPDSRVSIVTDSWRMLRDSLRVRGLVRERMLRE